MVFVRDDRRRNGCFTIADTRDYAVDVYSVPYGTNEIAGNVISIDDENAAIWLYLEADLSKLKTLRPRRATGTPEKIYSKLLSLGFHEYRI